LRKHAKGEQQKQCAAARHDEIELCRAQRLWLAIIDEDQHPGGQRHRLPGNKEGKRIVREHGHIHRGYEERKDRQNPLRLVFVTAVIDTVDGCRYCAPIHDGEEEGG
jgi:hypothetical protein